MLTSRADAYRLLRTLGAPERLITHLQLVGEAADGLLACYTKIGLRFDSSWLVLGVAIHDAGKLQFPEELDGPGNLHEAAGEVLMLAHGVQPNVARCCVSHAAWQEASVTFEELSVALADKLWKGKRESELELRVIDAAARKLGVSRWALFADLDTAFEMIAAGGHDRLARS
jgi:hypothetical protein